MRIHVIIQLCCLFAVKCDQFDCPIGCICPTSPIIDVNCSSLLFFNSTLQIDEKVQQLDLSNNQLATIPKFVSNLTNIIKLNLSNNFIEKIDGLFFTKLSKLELLDLSKNIIKKFSDINADKIFIKNLNLKFLNFSHNPLYDIGTNYDDILYSRSLEYLYLHNCDISYIQGPLCLQSLPKLIHLDLSSNELSRIDGLSSKSLISLDLTKCKLQFLRPDTLDQLTSLKYFYISHNYNLNSQYFKGKSSNLQYIDISYCTLDSINILQFPSVIFINFKGNRISILQSNIFIKNDKLIKIDLSWNEIYHINELAFKGADSLQYIDLSNNLITTINPNAFIFNENLLKLNLMSNSINTFTGLNSKSLIEINLSKNDMKIISQNSLINLENLKLLNLSYNLLETINLTSSSILKLDLSYCRITLIYNLNLIPSLEEILLTGNRLVTIKNHTIFTLLKHLNKISIDNNLWNCDCNDNSFKLLYNELKNKTTTPLTCFYPENMSGKSWKSACDLQWNQVNASSNFYTFFIIISILVIASLFGCYITVKEQDTFFNGHHCRENQTESINEEEEAVTRRTRADSIRKLSQLPSYDEALLLPKPSTPSEGEMSKSKKRQSATQTDETINELLQEISNESTRRRSLEQVEYINFTPKRQQNIIQSTEL